MRHRCQGKQLSRTASHRKALLRNLVTQLFEHERIRTTVPKARETRRVAERLITSAKRAAAAKNGSLHARRRAAGYIRDEKIVRKLFDTIAPWYMDRPGGYTRILKLGNRLGDGGEVGILELVKTGELLAADLKAREEEAQRRVERKAERAKARADAEAEAEAKARSESGEAEPAEEVEEKPATKAEEKAVKAGAKKAEKEAREAGEKKGKPKPKTAAKAKPTSEPKEKAKGKTKESAKKDRPKKKKPMDKARGLFRRSKEK